MEAVCVATVLKLFPSVDDCRLYLLNGSSAYTLHLMVVAFSVALYNPASSLKFTVSKPELDFTCPAPVISPITWLLVDK